MKLLFSNFIHLVKRFKASVILNILGLSVAFAVFIVITIQALYDAGYNRNFEKSKQLSVLRFYYTHDDYEGETVSMPYAKNIAEKIPEIKNHTIFSQGWSNRFRLQPDDHSPVVNITTSYITEGFSDMFRPQVVKGDISAVFSATNKAAISRKHAKNLFGEEDPLQKRIYFYGNKAEVEIVAVYEDFPDNCSFSNGIFLNLPFNEDSSEWSYIMYMEVDPSQREAVERKLNTDDIMGEGSIARHKEKPEEKVELRILPVEEIYMKKGNNKTTFLSLVFIGLIILAIAYVNYFNFSVAMVPSRVKAVNMHKILGISRMKLRATILFEGIFLALIAIGLALLIISGFAGSTLRSFFAADLQVTHNLPLIGTISMLLLLGIVLVGLYPAYYLSSFPERVALSSSFALSPKGIKVRNVLLAIQFTAAITISCLAVYIKTQHLYMQHFSTGIEKENIVYLPLRGLNTDIYTLGEEMKKNPNILSFTASEAIPGNVRMGWGRNIEDKQVRFVAWPVIPGFLDFFGIKVIAGTDFTPERNDSIAPEQVIVNHQFMERYGFTNDLIGKHFPTFKGGVLNGVAGDVNFSSLHNAIEPMAFVVLDKSNREQRLQYIFFKLSGNQLPETIDYMCQTWGQFNKESFNLTFLDQQMNALYKRENNMARLISLFGIIIIIVSIMGVYGLTLFNTRYKTKEIAIRKVNGSSIWEVVWMLNKALLLLLPVSFAISIVFSYWLINKWGEQFAYKAPLDWWIFLSAGLLVALVTALTVSRQSWKAATMNPVNALKNE